MNSNPSILGLHHVQITVPTSAVDDARDFYCGILGLEEIPKPAALLQRGGLWIRAGDRDVHVGVEDGFERQKSKAHVAYEVNDLKLWKEKLNEHGISFKEGIPIPGHDRLEFRDPFGNRVELITCPTNQS